METTDMSETTEFTTQKEPLSQIPLQEQISLRAYYLYASRGYLHGLDLQGWLQAEQQVLQEIDRTTQAARAAAA
jgi:hypothetical protein